MLRTVASRIARPVRPVSCISRRLLSSARSITVNDRSYTLRDDTRIAAILLDGSAQEYWDAAVDAGVAPNAERLFFGRDAVGEAALVDSCVPTFTNPNNVAVIAGAPPAVTVRVRVRGVPVVASSLCSQLPHRASPETSSSTTKVKRS